MRKEVKILLAEDDDGHAELIRKNLQRAGISNEILSFKDGEDVLRYLFVERKLQPNEDGQAYLLLLDLRMPRVDGEEVLRQIKADDELKKISVIIITTCCDSAEVEKCHQLGCSNFIPKPVEYDIFIETIRKLGLFLMIVEVPNIK